MDSLYKWTDIKDDTFDVYKEEWTIGLDLFFCFLVENANNVSPHNRHDV